MTKKKKYSIKHHGNFVGLAENNKLITGLFDSYDKMDIQKIVDLLNKKEDHIEQLRQAFIEDVKTIQIMSDGYIDCQQYYEEKIQTLEEELNSYEEVIFKTPYGKEAIFYQKRGDNDTVFDDE